jgi:hypothetical protein
MALDVVAVRATEFAAVNVANEGTHLLAKGARGELEWLDEAEPLLFVAVKGRQRGHGPARAIASHWARKSDQAIAWQAIFSSNSSPCSCLEK